MAKHTFYQFLQDYPNDATCLNTIMVLRYGDKLVCCECKRETKYHRIGSVGRFCVSFAGHVYPCVGTPVKKSSTSLHKWFYAIYLFTATSHDVSGKELDRQWGVTYKTAWRMGHEIRKLIVGMEKGGLFGRRPADCCDPGFDCDPPVYPNS